MNMVIFFAVQVVAAVVVLLFIRFFFAKQFSGTMKKLQVLNKENLVREAQVKEELKKAKLDYAKKIKEASAQGQDILNEANEEAIRIRTQTTEQARADAERMIDEARIEAERQQTRILAESKEMCKQWSKELVISLFEGEQLEILHHAVVGMVFGELEKEDSKMFEQQTREVQIATAFHLSTEEREHIEELIKKKMGSSVEIIEEINEDLIAGLLIHISDQVVDGSLNHRFEFGLLELQRLHEEGAGRS